MPLSKFLKKLFGAYEGYSLLAPLFISGFTRTPDSIQLELMAPNLDHAQRCRDLFTGPLQIVFEEVFEKSCAVTFWNPEYACIYDKALDLTWDEELKKHPAVLATRQAYQNWEASDAEIAED